MIIRRIEKKDDAAVAAIIRSCLVEYGGDNRPDTAWADPCLDRFSEVYTREDNAYWVAENEDKTVVAGVGIGPLAGADGVCELQKMYCLPAYRGKGIASALLQTALAFAKQHYKCVYLETMDNMERAKRFYEKNGFIHTDKTIGNTGHGGCNYHYIKYLNHPEEPIMLKILFQGDSITDGNRYKEESSRWDLNHQIGHSWAYVVASSLGYRFPMRFAFVNRAISGNTVSELNDRWEKDAIAENPDVICLLVGTNDCLRNIKNECDLTCAKYKEGLTALFDRSIAANPAVRFIVLEPFCFPDSDMRASCMNRIREIARETAAHYNALFIPLQKAFDEQIAKSNSPYWLWDTTHPTEAGHGLIADAFLKAAEPLLLSLSSR